MCPDYEVRYCCDENASLNENWIQLPDNLKQHAGKYQEKFYENFDSSKFFQINFNTKLTMIKSDLLRSMAQPYPVRRKDFFSLSYDRTCHS